MAELADHHYPPGTDTAGVARDHEDFREQVREFCRHRRHEQGNAYVTATKVVREFDVTPQRAGATLAALADDGDLEVWKEATKKTTYRIHVDEGGGRDE